MKSPTFTLKVVELPYVKQLDLEYRFPAYTGLAPRVVEDGGDVATLSGTDVRLKIQPTMATRSGRVVMHDGTTSPLTRQPRRHAGGQLHRHQQRVLQDRARWSGRREGGRLAAVRDRHPRRPGAVGDAVETGSRHRRDAGPGVRRSRRAPTTTSRCAICSWCIRSTVARKRRFRCSTAASPRPEVTAGHTFYLEELGVQPGDAVSYYARATDNDATAGPKTATSDIYFLRIRPFGKDFKPAQSMGGGGGGGGGAGGEVGALSQQQRQIIAGTFKVQRDRKAMGAVKAKEALVVLALSQSRLKEQVQGLVDRMNSRLVTPDPSFKKIAEVLPLAVGEMKSAEGKLQAQKRRAGVAVREQGASVPAAGRRRVRTAGADAAQRRRWRRWWRRGIDCRGPGRTVQARTGQDGQPVRDQPARDRSRAPISRSTSWPKS